MTNAYSADLAHIHDAAFTTFADAACTLLLDTLRARRVTTGRIVDLGCGSGTLAAFVVAHGYRALGIDISESFIELTRRRAPEAEFRCQSLLTADIPPCVAVTAIGECINYLFDEAHSIDAVVTVFQRVYDALDEHGVFLFDAAGPGRAGPTGRSSGCTDGGDWLVAYSAEEDTETQSLTRRITSFRRDGDLYRRTDETHRLRLLAHAEIHDALERIGFHVQVLDGYRETRFPHGWSGFLATKS